MIKVNNRVSMFKNIYLIEGDIIIKFKIEDEFYGDLQ